MSWRDMSAGELADILVTARGHVPIRDWPETGRLGWLSDLPGREYGFSAEDCRELQAIIATGALDEALLEVTRDRADLQESYRVSGCRWSSHPMRVLREAGIKYQPRPFGIPTIRVPNKPERDIYLVGV